MLSTKLLNFVIIISISTIIVLFLTEKQFFLSKSTNTNNSIISISPTPMNPITATPIVEKCDESYLPAIGKVLTYSAKTTLKSFKYTIKRVSAANNLIKYEINNDPSQIIQNVCRNSFITGVAPIQALVYLDSQSNPKITSDINSEISLLETIENFHLIPNHSDILSTWNSLLKVPTGIKLFGLEYVDLDIRHNISSADSKKETIIVDVTLDTNSSQLITKYLSDYTNLSPNQPIISYKVKKGVGLTKFTLNSDLKKISQLDINLLAD